MGNDDLTGFFEKFLKKDTLFLDKKVLQSAYIQNDISQRYLYGRCFKKYGFK